jgi:hypothetical protein
LACTPAEIPNAYCDVGTAATGVRAYHNSLSAPATARNNTGAGVIFISAGNFTYNADAFPGEVGTPISYLKMGPASGVARSQAIFNAKTAGSSPPKLWLDNISISIATEGGNVFTGASYLKVSNCIINPVNENTFYQNVIMSFFGNTIQSINALPVSTTANISASPMVGNTFSRATPMAGAYVFVGNTNSVINGGTLAVAPIAITPPASTGAVIADNYLPGTQLLVHDNAGDIYAGGVFGVFIENNVFETTNGSTPYIKIAGSSSTADNVYNIILRNSTFVGYLTEWCYNAYSAAQTMRLRKYCKMQGCISSRVTTMTDITTEGGDASANRIGSWAETNGVGHFGNLTLTLSSEDYAPEFIGIIGKWDAGGADFVLDASQSGTDTGNGDYRLTVNSPARSLVGTGLRGTLFDLDGILRYNDGKGSAGAYEYRIVGGGAALMW